MSESLSYVRIELHREHFHHLPPTPGFPKGIRLIPGLNTVPKKYLEELEERVIESKAFQQGGRTIPARKRIPAQEMWAALQKPVHYRDTNGSTHFGPTVTIHTDALEDRQDGPPPPPALPMNKDTARRIIASTTERAALERWSSQNKGDIGNLVRERIRELSNGGLRG